MTGLALAFVASPARAAATAERDALLVAAGLGVARVVRGAGLVRRTPGSGRPSWAPGVGVTELSAVVRRGASRRRGLEVGRLAGVLRALPELAVLTDVSPAAIHLDGGLGIDGALSLARAIDALGLGRPTATLTADDLATARADGPSSLIALEAALGGIHVESADLLASVAVLGPRWIADLPVTAVDAPLPGGGPLGTADAPLRVAVVGSMGWSSGVDTVVRAVIALGERGVASHLTLVGAGPNATEAAFSAHSAGVLGGSGATQVHLVHDLVAEVAPPSGPAWRAVGDADVVVNPSLISTGGPGPRLASAWGRPVIVAAGPGAPAPAGSLVVPRRDPGGLADALARLAADGPERLALGADAAAARATPAELVATWSAVARRTDRRG